MKTACDKLIMLEVCLERATQIQFVLTNRGMPIEFALLKIPDWRPYEARYQKGFLRTCEKHNASEVARVCIWDTQIHAVVMNTTYFNHTGYGPLPFWDDLTNYTTFNNRDFVQHDDEKPVPAAPFGLATGAFFIFACGLKKVLWDTDFLLFLFFSLFHACYTVL